MPRKLQIAFIGSVSHYGHTESLCKALGYKLAQEPFLTFLDGGVTGIPETITTSLYRKDIIHLVPFTEWPSEEYSKEPLGTFLRAGRTDEDRQEILGRMADVVIMIEGGPGALNEALIAHKEGKKVICVPTTSPFCKKFYDQCGGNPLWDALGDETKNHDFSEEPSNKVIGDIVEYIIKSIYE